MKNDKTNEFTSRDEELSYWENFDLSEHLDDAPIVHLDVKKPLTHSLTMRLTRDDLVKLHALASANGVGVTTMARILLHRVLQKAASVKTP